jgi:serine protease Do
MRLPALRVPALIFALLVTGPALAAVTPELQRAIRAATFEVVMKKPTQDPVSYEKPLPLELLPYIERTDLYESIGTAFAIGKNTYLTAAHVVTAAIDGQYGPPELRSSDGKVYPMGKLLKFSAHEDFVVFSLADGPDLPGFQTTRTRSMDDPVFAVGNALGEGIVIRDGLFTSETPEQQDGRWKWIRFSAAASPGNSGGPLLDAQGKVIGIVIAKSANENLNYALPIDIVLDAPDSKARFEQRRLVTLPYLHGSKTYSYTDEFPLPLNWPQFARAYQSVTEKHNDAAREQLLLAYSDLLFPKGEDTESILYAVDTAAREMGVVIQQSNNNWKVEKPHFDSTDLPGDGSVAVARAAGATLLRLRRGNQAADSAFFADSKSFMDIALKALNVTRAVGSDRVRVTSLGAAVSDVQTRDGYGRVWQERVWPIPFMNSYLVALLMPTPDGYAALIDFAPSMALREDKIRLGLLANQVTLPYEGTLAQWQAFLGRAALLPAAMKGVTLDPAAGWKLHTRRFETTVPATLMKMDGQSKLLVDMAYMYDGQRVVWDIGGAWWFRDAEQKSYVGLWRQVRPPATAKLDLRNRFSDLQEKRAPYDGQPVRDGADTFTTSTMIQAPGTTAAMVSGDVAYALTLRVEHHPSLEQISAQREATLKATRILEHGVGKDMTASQTPPTSPFLDPSSAADLRAH